MNPTSTGEDAPAARAVTTRMSGPVAVVLSLGLAMFACDGNEVLDLKGDASVGNVQSDGAVSEEEGASSTDSSRADADSDGSVEIVSGSTFPCGTNVCSAPNVCCEEPLSSVTPAPCEATSLCNGLAVACTAATCPAGSLCCATPQAFPGSPNATFSGSAQCYRTTVCPSGTEQVCEQTPDSNPAQDDCPSGYVCGGFLGGLEGCIRLAAPDGGPED